jgi:hypothetical protein
LSEETPAWKRARVVAAAKPRERLHEAECRLNEAELLDFEAGNVLPSLEKSKFRREAFLPRMLEVEKAEGKPEFPMVPFGIDNGRATKLARWTFGKSGGLAERS